MVQSAMKTTKLRIKPLVGFLQHSAFWEGPCRAGKKENLMPEAEREWAKNQFPQYVDKLKDVIPEVEILEPVAVPYIENLTVEQEIWDKIEEDLDKTDAFLVTNNYLAK